MRLFLTFITLLLLSVPAQAQSEDPILTLPDGQVILSLSATERKEVEQDLLVATLSKNVTNRDSAVVQNEINQAMKKALDLFRKEKGIKVNTGTYQIYETSDNRSKEKLWAGSQSLTLQSKDAETLLKLAGSLQDMGLNMNGLSYTLAPETAIAVQDGLMEDALKQLQTRADRAAKALGKATAELRDVSVNDGGVPYYPVAHARGMMMEMADAGMAAPVAAAGDSTITMTVSARAILKP